MIADIQESRVEPGQNRLARTSGIRPEADISLECLKMSANDPKRTLGKVGWLTAGKAVRKTAIIRFSESPSPIDA